MSIVGLTWITMTSILRDRSHWLVRLLRKEVIQPQVPLRLPCYDLVPITEFALGGCVSCEFTHRL